MENTVGLQQPARLHIDEAQDLPRGHRRKPVPQTRAADLLRRSGPVGIQQRLCNRYLHGRLHRCQPKHHRKSLRHFGTYFDQPRISLETGTLDQNSVQTERQHRSDSLAISSRAKSLLNFVRLSCQLYRCIEWRTARIGYPEPELAGLPLAMQGRGKQEEDDSRKMDSHLFSFY